MPYSDRDKEIISHILTRRELVDAAKQGYKELVKEYVQVFGVFALKTVAVAIIGALAVFVINFGGLGK